MHAPPCDHKVLFYPSDAELARVVGAYLVAAHRDGAIAVVIATPEHRADFDRALVAGGVDPDAAREDGTLVMLDAAETLGRFLDDHTPNPERFAAVVGGAIRDAAAGGREVRAYGEMVALLWDDGYAAAALELEVLWNGLRQQVPFSLFCAYPSSIQDDGRSPELEQVCRLHSGIIGEGSSDLTPTDAVPVTQEASLSLEHTLTAPGSARLFVRDVLSQWQLAHLWDDAAVVATELVTNASRHADSRATLTLERVPDGVRVSVADEGGSIPRVREASSPPELGGRGLRIIATLSRDWGFAMLPEGKRVWAVLPDAPNDRG
jgi:anti-sigma regulatory factor (Ser/Thr protein kinase)